MQEQDARNIAQYLSTHVQPRYQNMLKPRVAKHKPIAVAPNEAHVVIPVDGASSARRAMARIVSEFACPEKILFPTGRSELTCMLEATQSANQYGLDSHNGLIWLLVIEAGMFVQLPNAQAYTLAQLFDELGEEEEQEDDPEDFDLEMSYLDSPNYRSESDKSREPGELELKKFSSKIAKQLCQPEHEALAECLLTPGRRPKIQGQDGRNRLFVHGIENERAATVFARDVVRNIHAVSAVSLMDLKGPAIDYSPQWQGRYCLAFAEVATSDE